ncbi:MAG: carboxylesterase family protein, partial [Desulfatitalea sp.]|nr:carboxylesterase family protein [Desulfatitalea sp.]
DNVTIFGESGGGGKVQHLLPSPLAAGLFHKAIIQSGMYPRQTTPLAAAEAQGEELATILGVDGKADPLAAMRAMNWMEVDGAMSQLVERTAVVPNVCKSSRVCRHAAAHPPVVAGMGGMEKLGSVRA